MDQYYVSSEPFPKQLPNITLERTTKHMAKVTINKLLEALSGAIGGLVFRQMPDGTIILSGAPRHNKRKTTQKQKAHRQRFREAAKHARWAAHEHPIYAELAKGTWKSAYNFALSDWWHPPVIHRIERRDGRILVEASDNIMVAKVYVTIFDGENKIVEMGDAIRQEGNRWAFASQAAGKTVKAQAWDLADNVTKVVV